MNCIIKVTLENGDWCARALNDVFRHPEIDCAIGYLAKTMNVVRQMLSFEVLDLPVGQIGELLRSHGSRFGIIVEVTGTVTPRKLDDPSSAEELYQSLVAGTR